MVLAAKRRGRAQAPILAATFGMVVILQTIKLSLDILASSVSDDPLRNSIAWELSGNRDTRDCQVNAPATSTMIT